LSTVSKGHQTHVRTDCTLFKTGFARFSHRSVVLPLPHKISLRSILRGFCKMLRCAVAYWFPSVLLSDGLRAAALRRLASGRACGRSPAQKGNFSCTLYTQNPLFAVAVFACPAHVRAGKQVFPFFDSLRARGVAPGPFLFAVFYLTPGPFPFTVFSFDTAPLCVV